MGRYWIAAPILACCLVAFPDVSLAQTDCIGGHDFTTPQDRAHALTDSRKLLAASLPVMATGLLANRTGFVMLAIFIAHTMGGGDADCRENCARPFTADTDFLTLAVGLIVGGFVVEAMGLVLLGQSIRYRKRSRVVPDIFIVPDLEAGKARFFFSWRF